MTRLFSCTLLLAGVMIGAAVPAARADDATAAGEAVYKRACIACHAVEADKNKIGPSLFGVVGRVSGSVPGYNYSDANKAAKITWTAETLDTYLTDPKAMVPGTKMTYVGLKKPEDRQAIIAYLATLH